MTATVIRGNLKADGTLELATRPSVASLASFRVKHLSDTIPVTVREDDSWPRCMS
jgi:hypothetical protein